MPGPLEMIIIGVIAVLLFGKRLPEVGRSVGKGLMEFKRGIRGMEDEVDSAASRRSSPKSRYSEPEDRDEVTVPKFEPPPEEPAPAAETKE
ncbi:MAG: twin-arginine translocase TatA/TatE family subunit [Planctomycetia bacterium]|nr:twin-arginine translocase TatA/TatE family subunit [Planctomycetia bacterium]